MILCEFFSVLNWTILISIMYVGLVIESFHVSRISIAYFLCSLLVLLLTAAAAAAVAISVMVYDFIKQWNVPEEKQPDKYQIQDKLMNQSNEELESISELK